MNSVNYRPVCYGEGQPPPQVGLPDYADQFCKTHVLSFQEGNFAGPLLDLMYKSDFRNNEWVLLIFNEAASALEGDLPPIIARATAPSLLEAFSKIYRQQGFLCYATLYSDGDRITHESMESVSNFIAGVCRAELAEGNLGRFLYLCFEISRKGSLNPVRCQETQQYLATLSLEKALPYDEALRNTLSPFIPSIFSAMQRCDREYRNLYNPIDRSDCDCCVFL